MRNRRLSVAATLLLLSAGAARAQSQAIRVPLPPRPWNAIGGAAFIDQIKNLSFTQREDRIRQELVAGNVPGFARTFQPVRVSAVIGGVTRNATFYVMPDYLCIGSNGDFVRMPMSPLVGQPVLDLYGCAWPTRKMVDAIWQQAPVKLAPIPLSPNTYDITAVTTFYLHHQLIEQQRAGLPLGPVVAGTKKDVVVTPRLATNPGRVAIYGWHQTNGTPIQPLSLVHTITYVDYSHGVRPVYGDMRVDGIWRRVTDVLADPALNVLISDEGPISNPRY